MVTLSLWWFPLGYFLPFHLKDVHVVDGPDFIPVEVVVSLVDSSVELSFKPHFDRTVEAQLSLERTDVLRVEVVAVGPVVEGHGEIFLWQDLHHHGQADLPVVPGDGDRLPHLQVRLGHLPGRGCLRQGEFLNTERAAEDDGPWLAPWKSSAFSKELFSLLTFPEIENCCKY